MEYRRSVEGQDAEVSHTTRRSGYIDSWRFVAVALVIFAHHHKMRDESIVPETTPYFFWGQVGVYVFFFISGFVVSKACLAEVQRTGSFSAPAFYTRRAFRIVPPLLVYLAACAFLDHREVIDIEPIELVSAAGYVCNVEWAQCGWWVAHTWSLAYEEQFYLLFAVLFLWRHTGRRPGAALLVAVLGFALLPLLAPRGPSGLSGFPVVYALFLGGYLFARHEARWLGLRFPLLGFLLGALVTFTPPLYVLQEEHRKFYKLMYVWSIPLMVVATGSARFVLRRLFELRPLRYLGLISYSIYLWQQLVSGLVAGAQPALVQAAAWTGMVLGCVVLFEWFEKPLIALSRRLSRHMNEPAVVNPPRQPEAWRSP